MATTLTFYEGSTPETGDWTDNKGNYYRVLAWMELPAAYKEEEYHD